MNYWRWRLGLAAGYAIRAIGYRMINDGWRITDKSARLYREGWQ
jgi:hypothetical protein